MLEENNEMGVTHDDSQQRLGIFRIHGKEGNWKSFV